ncbi:MAG: hypothetical protein G3M78_09570 [Candidatus Nitrohelix vancouverensis]|uniref:Uncharacterized protein n=1 Tax=Candidatus Nitrohelix vancouverensis TaxID=2705534 RepID=A0A7T0G3S1_9BACT|nr:MAG: hypothetical protein G3M78_09570 [Candidatus Nitrohelix vancouverensis]
MLKNQTIQGLQETILESVEKIWLQIDQVLGIEQTSVFQLFKPFLFVALENPLILSASLVALFGIPYAFIKIRKINAEAEEQYDAIIQRMDFDESEEVESEEEDMDDSRPLFPDSRSSVEDEDTALAILTQLDREEREHAFDTEEEEDAYDVEENIEDLQAIAESLDDEESASPGDLEDSQSDPFDGFDLGDDDATAKPAMALEDDDDEMDPALKALLNDTLDFSEEPTPVSQTLAESGDHDEFLQDQAILDLQSEMENSISELQQQLDASRSPEKKTEPDDSDIEDLMKETFDFSSDNDSEDDEFSEQNQEILNLQKEMEDSINQISEQIAEPVSFNVNFDNLDDEPTLEDILKEDEEAQAATKVDSDDDIEFTFEEESEPAPATATSSRNLEEELTLPEDLEDFHNRGMETSPVATPSANEPKNESVIPDNINPEDFFNLEDLASDAEDAEDAETVALPDIETEEVHLELEPEPIGQAQEPEDDLFGMTLDSPVTFGSPEVVAEEDTAQKEQPEYSASLEDIIPDAPPAEEPLYKPAVEKMVSGKVSRLVDKLNQFQEKIESRINHLDPGMQKVLKTSDFLKGMNYQKTEFKENASKPPINDEDYINLLESFIFLEEQKKK